MTGDTRRTVRSKTEGASVHDEFVHRQDFDKRFLVTDRNGRISLNLTALKEALALPAMDTAIAAAAEVETFAGAGTTGIVPDPLVEAGDFLRDDGTFATPAGGGDMLKAVYDTDDDGAVNLAEALDHQIANSELANMAENTIKGRDGPGAGAPEDLTAQETRDVIGQTTPTADGMPQADANNHIDVGWLGGGAPGIIIAPLPGAATTDAIWQPIDQNQVILRQGGLTDIDGLTIPQQGLLVRKAADIVSFTLSQQSVMARRTGDIQEMTASAQNRVFMRPDTGNLAFWRSSAMLASMIDDAGLAGTSFPSHSNLPLDGTPFYRTDLGMAFVYDDTYSAWLSVAEWTIKNFAAGTLGINAYLDHAGINGATTTGTSAIGDMFPFDVVPVWVTAQVQTTPAVSTTFEVVDDGGTLTPAASITITNPAVNNTTNWIQAGTTFALIASGSIVNVRVTAGSSSQAVDGSNVLVGFRRIET